MGKAQTPTSPISQEATRPRTGFPDRIVFRNGSIVECRILSTVGSTVRAHIKVAGIEAETTYELSEITRIDRDVKPAIVPPSGEAPSPRSAAKPAEAAVPAQAAPTERQQLLAAITGEYTGPGGKVPMSTDIKPLRRLADSHDPHVQRIARMAIGIHTLYSIINRRADFSLEGRQLLVQALQLALTTDDSPEDMLRGAIDAVNDPNGAMEAIIGRVSRLADDGDRIQRAQNTMREAVKRMLLEPTLPDFKDADFALKFSPFERPGAELSVTSDGYLILTNRSDAPLHAVTCVIDVHASDAKIDQAIAAEKRRWSGPNLLTTVIGIRPELQGKNLQNTLRYYERLRLGYGQVAYIPSLPKNARATIGFASLGDLDHVVDEVNVLVVCDGVGRKHYSMDIEKVRAEIERAVRAQAEKSPRPR